ncbi:hypothetical protein, partial [Escherichia coli]|uniref:hypothetical protein n=1 Tax=Escherichia coli TaxID=562 RepID=UPI002237F7DB|nr:hypothetical protein [Escherichia coli]
WKGWAILLRQKQKKLIMLPSETMIWQPEFTDKTLSRKPGAVQVCCSTLPFGVQAVRATVAVIMAIRQSLFPVRLMSVSLP